MKILVYIAVLFDPTLTEKGGNQVRMQSSVPPPTRISFQQEGRTGLPKDTQAMLDRLRQKVGRDAEIAELLSRAQSLYQEGMVLSKKGDIKASEIKFDLSRQTILSVDEAVFYQPGVRTYFLKLSRDIASLSGGGAPSFRSESKLAIDDNGQVRQFIKYLQGKGRNTVRVALNRLSRYEPMMRKVFQDEDVPEDLIYLGLVESAYNPYAQSSAGAVGIWQFVRDTGRRYGLKQVGGIDQRHDPEKSTRAAARYLRELYDMFGDWQLALAGYNAGEYRVLKVIKKTGIRDFNQMSERGLLPRETLNYVPAVMAAIAIGKNRRN